MFDHRSPLILGAGPIGLVLASIAWLLFGAHASALARLDDLTGRLTAANVTAGQNGMAVVADPVQPVLATPLFALASGTGAAADIAVRLDGIAITGARRAALVSIGGKPADWLEAGATRDGVTLMEVQATKVTLDTAAGFKDVTLWQGPPTGNGSTGATAPSPELPRSR